MKENVQRRKMAERGSVAETDTEWQRERVCTFPCNKILDIKNVNNLIDLKNKLIVIVFSIPIHDHY